MLIIRLNVLGYIGYVTTCHLVKNTNMLVYCAARQQKTLRQRFAIHGMQ